MPAKLPPPVIKRIKLFLPKDEDPEQDTYVDIRQATQREEEFLAELTAEASRVFRSGDDAVEVKSRYSVPEIERIQAQLTLSDCNIVVPDQDTPEDEEKALPLFRFQRQDGAMRVSMTDTQFKAAWGRLPSHWATKIHEAVLEVNQQWKPGGRGE